MQNRFTLITGALLAVSLSACATSASHSGASAASAPEVISRRQLDYQFAAWCISRKALPEHQGVCYCVVDQMHIQGLDDAAAHRVGAIIRAAADGSDAAFETLAPQDEAKLAQAAGICGARLSP